MRARRRWCALALAATAALSIAPNPSALADHEDVPEPPILPCSGLGRELAADLPLRDDDQTFTINVLVLADRVPDHLDVDAVISRAGDAYEAAGVTVSATIERRDFSGTDVARIMDQLRASLVGTGAEVYDAVLVESGVDLTTVGGVGIAGYATCLGGVRLKHQLQSLAIAEIGYGARTMPNASADLQLERDAFVAAHEIGHLFGARHEHGNCAENADADDLHLDEDFGQTCTIMGDLQSLSDLRFGAAETAVIRGHARHYSEP